MPICWKIMDSCVFHFNASTLFLFFRNHFQFFFLIFSHYETRRDRIDIFRLEGTTVVKLHMILLLLLFIFFFLLRIFSILKSYFRKQDCLNFREREREAERWAEEKTVQRIVLKRRGNFRRSRREGVFNLFLSGVIVLHIF